MRYAIVPRVLLHLLTQTAPVETRPVGITDQRRTPTEDKLVAAASPLQGGPRFAFRRPLLYAGHGALWAEAWLLKRLLVWVAWHSPPGSYWHAMSLAARRSLIPAAATSICFGILGGVILVTHILRLWLRWASANSQYRPQVLPMPSLPPHGALGRQAVKSSPRSMVLIPHRRNSRAS